MIQTISLSNNISNLLVTRPTENRSADLLPQYFKLLFFLKKKQENDWLPDLRMATLKYLSLIQSSLTGQWSCLSLSSGWHPFTGALLLYVHSFTRHSAGRVNIKAGMTPATHHVTTSTIYPPSSHTVGQTQNPDMQSIKLVRVGRNLTLFPIISNVIARNNLNFHSRALWIKL